MAFSQAAFEKSLWEKPSPRLVTFMLGCLPPVRSLRSSLLLLVLKLLHLRCPPFDYQPRPYMGHAPIKSFEKRKEVFWALSLSILPKPVVLVFLCTICFRFGKMQYLFDEDGRAVPGSFAGIVTVSWRNIVHPIF
ncbi:hypothetical protein M0R45_005228 [Rubus argutus]|uniref:Uncharacterized protein n=1 Tax=Rubus argutus TaxID=59490 RepID=A0AAW1YM78_RUBAR